MRQEEKGDCQAMKSKKTDLQGKKKVKKRETVKNWYVIVPRSEKKGGGRNQERLPSHQGKNVCWRRTAPGVKGRKHRCKKPAEFPSNLRVRTARREGKKR